MIAIGLAMDAFATSIVDGLRYQKAKKRHGIYVALTFGLFQGVMPVIGYFLGSLFIKQIEAYDHWVAFGLLLLIGGFMIFEGIKGIIKPESVKEKEFSWKEVFLQGVATSIDALAVGITLTTLKIHIAWDALTIAGITFIICIIGFFLGKQIAKLLKGKYSIANIIGGIILIAIGISIVIEHMM
ncbi:MAG: manganese efflux pump MntP family protein [Bacilli bacterium]|nr:manganese efflux pump MntP family protein [Bacilli bacterium]